MKEVSYKFGAENNFIHIVILQQYYNFIFGGIFYGFKRKMETLLRSPRRK